VAGWLDVVVGERPEEQPAAAETQTKAAATIVRDARLLRIFIMSRT
jgi:hypothetical protein